MSCWPIMQMFARSPSKYPDWPYHTAGSRPTELVGSDVGLFVPLTLALSRYQLRGSLATDPDLAVACSRCHERGSLAANAQHRAKMVMSLSLVHPPAPRLVPTPHNVARQSTALPTRTTANSFLKRPHSLSLCTMLLVGHDGRPWRHHAPVHNRLHRLGTD